MYAGTIQPGETWLPRQQNLSTWSKCSHAKTRFGPKPINPLWQQQNGFQEYLRHHSSDRGKRATYLDLNSEAQHCSHILTQTSYCLSRYKSHCSHRNRPIYIIVSMIKLKRKEIRQPPRYFGIVNWTGFVLTRTMLTARKVSQLECWFTNVDWAASLWNSQLRNFIRWTPSLVNVIWTGGSLLFRYPRSFNFF